MRKRIHQILSPAAAGDTASRIFDIFILSLIAVNVAAIIIESVKSVGLPWKDAFYWFEAFSVAVFSVEYLLRLWSVPEGSPGQPAWKARLRFFFAPLGQVDLWAVLPFFLPFLGVDLRVLRTVRLFRLARIAKVGRYSKAVQLLGRVIRSRRAELAMTFCVLVVLLILSSTMMYFAENEAQPEAFASIPHSMWWAVSTLTTVGYGDVYPVTVFGKIMAAAIAILGIGMFALPTGILGAAFVEEMRPQRATRLCPHCGRQVDSPPEPREVRNRESLRSEPMGSHVDNR
jgi:voltage-gated potassium channel